MVLKDEPVEILLSKYGLWDEFVKLYKEKRGPTLWPPQVSALEKGALDNKNFLMVSSAGSGKTHIAEIIIFHSVMKKTKPAVYLAPYNALVEQKTDDFKDLFESPQLGFKVSKSTLEDESDDLAKKSIEFYDHYQNLVTKESVNSYCGDIVSNIIIDFIKKWGSIKNSNKPQGLVFAPKRKYCVDLSEKISEYLSKVEIVRGSMISANVLEEISKKMDFSDGGDTYLIKTLKKTISTSGVAFHHAGLSSKVKRILEREFEGSNLLVLVSTTTLAAGINLPVKRVIITEPKVGLDDMLVSDYKNLAGRAGRPKYTSEPGECVIVSDRPIFTESYKKNYIFASIEPLESKINLKEHLGIILNLARGYPSVGEIVGILDKSLFGMQKNKEIFGNNFIDSTYWGTSDIGERIAPIFARTIRTIRIILKESDTKLYEIFDGILENLQYMTFYGVKEEHVQFIKLGIVKNRNLFKNLEKNAITTVDDLIIKDIRELSTLLGKELSLFDRLFETSEKKFELAIEDSMKILEPYLSVTPFHDQSISKPEFEGYLKDSKGKTLSTIEGGKFKLCIECKSTTKLTKLVNTDSALEVLKKCPATQYTHKVVIGTPSFEENAKQSAEDHNILLIPISVYARLLLLAKQNKINELILASIFNEIGELTTTKLKIIIDKGAQEQKMN